MGRRKQIVDEERAERTGRRTRRACAWIALALCFAIAAYAIPGLLHPEAFVEHNRRYVIPMLLSLVVAGLGWLQRQTGDGDAAFVQRTQRLAARDTLTGLPNRRSLNEDGSMLLERFAKRRKPIAVIALNVDQFKAVNDTHGLAVGDALIRTIATEWGAVIPQTALSARIGGGEFACAFPFPADQPESVEAVAQQIAARFVQPFDCAGVRLHINAAIGIARSDFGADTIDALLRCAALATTAARRAGHNSYCWFDRSMEREIQARLELESGLRHAIPRQEIVPYFEPQIDLPTGRIAGFEVLARWEHPQRGLIPPDTFIGVAEESGLIGDMSLSIMHQAFVAARDWHPALTLSVNISPFQLKDPWLAQKIIKTLTETSFPARRLEVELTESALFDNLPLAQSIVGSLKNQGIRVALDDFGTGYSSLAHLRALPFDRIKIDKSFVLSIHDSADSMAIVMAILGLGESLHLPITAEGIETPEIEARLRELGCAKGQGYLYGRPVSIANVRRLLAERRLLAAQLEPRPQVVAPVEEATSLRRAG